MIALRYHDATKHQFGRYARSLGYLDWTTQPDPFRTYAGADLVALPREPASSGVSFGALYEPPVSPAAIDLASVGEFLRCALGLSAWKSTGSSRWALRVNPSSGNLHPTEGHVVWNGRIAHYAPREHHLEVRGVLDAHAWGAWTAGEPGFLLVLSSIHWREAWKYGERAFRYCQHDVGHALGAARYAAALLGWQAALLPRWSGDDMAQLLGFATDGALADAGEAPAEPEEPDCVLAITAGPFARSWAHRAPAGLLEAAARVTWRGRPNRLSPAHQEWPVIEQVTVATRSPGGLVPESAGARLEDTLSGGSLPWGIDAPPGAFADLETTPDVDARPARSVILTRRSAVAFDGRTSTTHASLQRMLRRLQPGRPPWDAWPWRPQVHLGLFVHRVEGLVPGMYVWCREDSALPDLMGAMRPEFLWERVGDEPLYLLAPFDVRGGARRLSCDQDIAADGYLSLAMLARFEPVLHADGAWAYRRLFWECGLIGQVLYLEAEARGARGTGIGCFFDDPVHEVFGLTGHDWQSLYHFSMGVPVEDRRLETTPGYDWERL